MSKDKSGSWFGRHKILTGIGALIVIGVIASAAGGSSSTNSNTGGNDNKQSETAKSENKQVTAKIGETARDGQFEFTVKSVTCGKPSVTDSSGYLTKTAQGQYCLMDVTVKNIGDKQQYFAESDQKILNSANQQYSPDSAATLTNGNNSNALLAQINPGNSVAGVLVFDIPKDQNAVTAELHDSAFSGGVKVTLQ